MPDCQGNYWFLTRRGLVGVATRGGKVTKVTFLGKECIDNALAVERNGVFVVSDPAMYAFRRVDDGKPVVEYDRGSGPKPCTMGHGSGTTSTLVSDGFVSITDNADGQVNVMVYLQQADIGDASRVVYQQPVFPADRGTSENSMLAVGRSLIVESNYGYQEPYKNISAEPSLA